MNIKYKVIYDKDNDRAFLVQKTGNNEVIVSDDIDEINEELEYMKEGFHY